MSRQKTKIRKGDKVIIVAGKDKGRESYVLKVVNDRAWVEGCNMIKKNKKPNQQTNDPGGIVSQEASLHISNINLANPLTGKAERVGYKFLEDGKKVRYFKSNGEQVNS